MVGVSEPRDPAYEVKCPFCQADPQQPCRSVFTHMLKNHPHVNRVHEAKTRGLYASS